MQLKLLRFGTGTNLSLDFSFLGGNVMETMTAWTDLMSQRNHTGRVVSIFSASGTAKREFDLIGFEIQPYQMTKGQVNSVHTCSLFNAHVTVCLGGPRGGGVLSEDKLGTLLSIAAGLYREN